MNRGITLGLLLVLAACDQKPDHYYVLCEGKDPKGWNLISTERDKTGAYIMACTYQSPDRTDLYTVRCTDKGCD